MFRIVKDAHINTGFSKDNRRTQFHHTVHSAYKPDKLIIRFHAGIGFNLGLGDHIVQIFQMTTGELPFSSLGCFNVIAFDSFNDFIGLGFCPFFNSTVLRRYICT